MCIAQHVQICSLTPTLLFAAFPYILAPPMDEIWTALKFLKLLTAYSAYSLLDPHIAAFSYISFYLKAQRAKIPLFIHACN